jgi:hypothetical protein
VSAATNVQGVVASSNSLLSHEAIIQMVGHEAFAQSDGHTSSSATSTTSMSIRSSHCHGPSARHVRDDYAVTVFLASSRSGAITVYRSQCTCPVALDCKHAAACSSSRAILSP